MLHSRKIKCIKTLLTILYIFCSAADKKFLFLKKSDLFQKHSDLKTK